MLRGAIRRFNEDTGVFFIRKKTSHVNDTIVIGNRAGF
jgi:hypothetical protein